MPILLPTVEEQQRMSWRAREQARRAVLAHVAQVRQARLAAEHARRCDLASKELGGQAIREEATRLLAEMPPDSNAELHWRTLAAGI